MALVLHTRVEAETPKVDRVKDCPVGLVCFTIDQMVEMQKRVIEMEKELALAKNRNRLVGGCLGIGGGYSLDTEALGQFKLQFDPSLGGYYVYGFRFPS